MADGGGWGGLPGRQISDQQEGGGSGTLSSSS
jgi:hypothetical protein